jgi:hypothetical protein
MSSLFPINIDSKRHLGSSVEISRQLQYKEWLEWQLCKGNDEAERGHYTKSDSRYNNSHNAAQ